MPRFPHTASRTATIGGSVFEQFRAKMAARGSDMCGLHIGDAHATPPYELPLTPDFVSSASGYHRYCDTFGIPELRDAIVEKLQDDNSIPASRDGVLVTAGATNALSATFHSLVDPGDEVIFLSPYWPFARGMVRLAGGIVVEVPFYPRVGSDGMRSPEEVANAIASRVTERTVALYLNSPNNPSGVVLSREMLGAVADVARRRNLWLISDEAYDGMTYDHHVHVSPASLPGMAEQTLSVFTFSKVFMFAGARIGYVAGAADVIATINKVMVHMLYSPATFTQQMLVAPLRTRASWRDGFVASCAAMREKVAAAIGFDAALPDGAYYFFFDAAPYLRGRASAGLIDACLDAGVAVAPGVDFGADFDTWLRVCYAGVAEDVVMRGVDRLNTVLLKG